MTPGLSIAWRDENPDTGRQEFEFVPDDRDVFVIYRDKDGRLICTGWGPHVDTDDELFDIATDVVIRLLKLDDGD